MLFGAVACLACTGRGTPSDDDATDASQPAVDAGGSGASRRPGLQVGGGTFNAEESIGITVVAAWTELDGGPPLPRRLDLFSADAGAVASILMKYDFEGWDLPLEASETRFELVDEESGDNGSFEVNPSALLERPVPISDGTADVVEFSPDPAAESFVCIVEDIVGRPVERFAACEPSCAVGDLSAGLYVLRMRSYRPSRLACEGVGLGNVSSFQQASERTLLIAREPAGHVEAALGTLLEGQYARTIVMVRATGMSGDGTLVLHGATFDGVTETIHYAMEQRQWRVLDWTLKGGPQDVAVISQTGAQSALWRNGVLPAQTTDVGELDATVTPTSDGSLTVRCTTDSTIVGYRFRVWAGGLPPVDVFSDVPEASFPSGTLAPGDNNQLEVLGSNRPLENPGSDEWVVRREIVGRIARP